MADAILLDDRGVVEVAGADAARFLHSLLTNDILSLRPGEARFCALLTPQGKIIGDFLTFAEGAGDKRRFLLDCPRALLGELRKRLSFYKLRAEVTIADRSEELASFAYLDAEPPEAAATARARDPRALALGWRALAAKGAIAASGDRAAYDARRIEAGVPEGGVDFAYGDAFPHEANMDLLAGVDFKKGCFVGQEVVARMQHRGLARKRVAPYRAEGVAPAPGQAILAGDKELGVTGSAGAGRGLALIRLDRLEEARAGGLSPSAGGTRLEFVEPTG